jgi:uncharacterized membrane protein YecN with MAPEG domain
MLSLPVTLTIAAGAALVNIWLMIRCGQARTKESVSIGDGGNEFVIRRMRAHANFVESAPFILILIAALEATSGTNQWLWGLGIVYIVGRLAHGLGMDGGSLGKGRMVGTLTTMITLLGLAGWALWNVYAAILETNEPLGPGPRESATAVVDLNGPGPQHVVCDKGVVLALITKLAGGAMSGDEGYIIAQWP